MNSPFTAPVVDWSDLLPYQFAARLEEFPFLYVPIGSLEWHGEHLAIGNDAIKMANLCRMAAQRSGGIVFPPIFFGIPGFADFDPKYEHDGGLRASPELLRAILLEVCRKAEEVGFRAAMLVTGHTCGEQIQLVKQVAAEYNAGPGRLHVIGSNDMEFGDAMNYTSDHAAHWETSILWYVRPDLVDLSRLDRDPDTPLHHVFGKDPRLYASRELGERVANVIADDMAALAAKTLSDLD